MAFVESNTAAMVARRVLFGNESKNRPPTKVWCRLRNLPSAATIGSSQRRTKVFPLRLPT